MIRCNLQGSEMSLTPCGPWNQADQTLNLGSTRYTLYDPDQVVNFSNFLSSGDNLSCISYRCVRIKAIKA